MAASFHVANDEQNGRTGGWASGRADGQTDGRTDGQTDSQKDRQTKRQAGRQAEQKQSPDHLIRGHKNDYHVCKFQGSSAHSVGGDSGQDRRTDGQTAEITT
ncbi:hypothetical protein DPMN_044107 [Dreissena polymorpha]|uniref:Uncharacterized protein n=1 Tax=Dreissena polymorpha TaxID=45954 RepID=A0A9D4HYF3_DREPO|nr:hypothetical protein DPMN_044107 [Dreissena polymorpha]